MKDEAIAPFIAETKALEGVVPFMYLDVVGLVTTGTGNLIDSGPHHKAVKPYKAPTEASAPLVDFDRNPLFREASKLDWRFVGIRPGTLPADEDNPKAALGRFQAEWRAVKARRDLALRGGVAFASVTSLRLTATGIEKLFTKTISRFEATLRTHLPMWNDLPIDAQIAVMLMAWGLGPNFPAKWPRCRKAIEAGDFATAAKESQSKTFSDDRNRAIRQRFTLAATCVDDGAA